MYPGSLIEYLAGKTLNRQCLDLIGDCLNGATIEHSRG